MGSTSNIVRNDLHRETTKQPWPSEWSFDPIFELCAGDKGYKGGGLRRDAWWCQEAAEKRHRSTLAYVLREANRREQRGRRATHYDPGKIR